MTAHGVTSAALTRRTARRRWGYLLWGIAGAVIGIPEITAAVDNGALPFTTISGMTGHLERHHSWVELVVVAAIVFAVFSVRRVPPHMTSGAQIGEADATEGFAERPSSGTHQPRAPLRTPAGRLTLRRVSETKEMWDDGPASALFGLAALASLAAIAVGTWAATRWWDDAHHYQPAYVLYGSLGLCWLVVPSILAFVRGLDMPFPTLFRTVWNLEEWLRSRKWRDNAGPILALGVSYVIFAGLTILLLHLTLYPYPDITKILNPNG
jgi:hypothetical protein